jgi:hypothetical protein
MNTNMFTRARLQLPLTPGERSFLKFIQGAVWSVILAGMTAVLPLIEQQTINWRTVITLGAGTLGVTAALSIQKYFTSQADTVGATIAGDVGTVIGQKTGVNDPQTPVAPPAAASNI